MLKALGVVLLVVLVLLGALLPLRYTARTRLPGERAGPGTAPTRRDDTPT